MLGFTKKTGYGLIAMAHLWTLDEGELSSAREIAQRYEVPMALLMTVLKELSAAGYVQSVRGAHGGYRLNADLDELTLAQFSQVLEGPIREAQCPQKTACDDDICTLEMMAHCPVDDPVHRMQRRLNDFLKNITLAEIIDPAAAISGR